MMSLMFQPFTQKNVTLPNRIVMSPMCMYSAKEDGKVTDWHRVHYGTRATGKVGLIMVEATAVERRGRISTKDLGLWNDSQIDGLREIVQFAHSQGVKTAIQLAHAGRKANTPEPVIAPSAIPFDDQSKMPEAMTNEEIQNVIAAFKEAARRAKESGFDIIEIHAAHGYLIHEFLSPLSNKRTDQYGGDLDGRAFFLQKVIEAVKTVWGEERPLYVRISAVDHDSDGIQLEDSIQLAHKLKNWGVDLIDVSSGGLLPTKPGKIYPGYQVPFADAIKKETGMATGTVGLITTPEQVEEILGNERADLVFIGRELLRNPYWVLNAVRKQDISSFGPEQYSRAL
ncbi:NADPH dehydrogenase NamA [Thermoactinomyces mirandus]|uniref:NADPH dehydrogenase NamA n=1 Tax=Thermoactinomyces mirandus TaxID=2756294 RepID=A0A7W1XUK1_9BACL|nr:NADPH dehydrogenase NamA [Thermoactinomyces mirandus]MBA4603573.1 NADPH dehydrogenase NamA [Thermoactinomyces mirandus]